MVKIGSCQWACCNIFGVKNDQVTLVNASVIDIGDQVAFALTRPSGHKNRLRGSKIQSQIKGFNTTLFMVDMANSSKPTRP